VRCRFIFYDWRAVGCKGSIYGSPLGVELSMRDLHSGTVLRAEVRFDRPEIEEQIREAWGKGAYPLLAMEAE